MVNGGEGDIVIFMERSYVYKNKRLKRIKWTFIYIYTKHKNFINTDGYQKVGHETIRVSNWRNDGRKKHPHFSIKKKLYTDITSCVN